MTSFQPDLMTARTVFVAGGTSGINLGIARRFTELGAHVAVLGRDAVKAKAAAESIGPAAIGLNADVRDYDMVRAAMEQAAAELGPLDVVFSGAAGNFLAPALGMSANGFRTVVDIDLNGTFNVFRSCHDLLRKPCHRFHQAGGSVLPGERGPVRAHELGERQRRTSDDSGHGFRVGFRDRYSLPRHGESYADS